MRTFIALEIPDGFRYEVAALARRLEERVDGRFVSPDNYHITLAFLGDVDQRDVGLAIDALEEACEGSAAPLLSCDGLGKFGNASDATLWLGVAATDAVVGIAQAVRDSLAMRGVAFDQKSFKPHITIARRAAIPKAALPPLPFPNTDNAVAATLFKSELDTEGAIYTPLHTVEFAR